MRRAARRVAHAHALASPYEASDEEAPPTPANVLARQHGQLTSAAPFDLAKALATHEQALAHA
jgi:hypothetical protein